MTRPPTGTRSDYAPDCLRGIRHSVSSEGSDDSGLLNGLCPHFTRAGSFGGSYVTLLSQFQNCSNNLGTISSCLATQVHGCANT
jgi:hypothetical protein